MSYANMTLGDLIDWLEAQDQDLIVSDGFGAPHSDRGSYDELAFDPLPEARISDMLAHARDADGRAFTGYKGGEFIMGQHTSVYIGEFGTCGDAITPITFKYWLLAPQLATLERELAEARKDAGRYRWLRAHRPVLLITGFFGDVCVNRSMREVDAAIDAAIAAAGEDGK